MEVLDSQPAGRRAVRLAAAALAGTLVLAAVFVPLTAGGASPSYSEDSIKAAYLYRFTQYVDWPDPVASDVPFTIAVLDAPDVAEQLRRLLADHLIKNAKAQVRTISTMQELGAARMLFVGTGYLNRLQSVISTLGTRPVLLVTDDADGLPTGSMVNFVTLDHRVRFEVSLTATDHSKLRISSELLGVAVHVHGGPHQTSDYCGTAAAPENGNSDCASHGSLRQAPLQIARVRLQPGEFR
jgi:YfiR/HmsC-like